MWKSGRLTGLLPLVLLYSCKRILIDSFVTPFEVRTTHNIFLSSVWCHNNDVIHSGKDYETIKTFETYWKVFEFLHQEVHFYSDRFVPVAPISLCPHPSWTEVSFLVCPMVKTTMGTWYGSRAFNKMHLENILLSY